MEEKSLKERTAGGMLWGGLSNGLMQLMAAVFGLVLLRYLTPDDYGKVAMLTIFSAIACALQESGFIAALCNRREPTHEEYNAVFWFNLLVSASLYIILWFCAPLIARFYGIPELVPLARVLFLSFFFSGLGTVQRAYLFGHLMVRQTS
ncbi:MAG: oligosaccharide flippase family protein, partial [Bacteroidaceae bacterium]|nr:oligosaccharide flippase family protein [Bacteroidaceae bacterium]